MPETKRIYIGNIKKMFSGVQEFKALGMKLDRAELKPLHVETSPAELVLDEKHKAVWNIDKAELATVVSPAYKVFQHRDFVDTAVETISNLGLPVKGNVIDLGNKVYATIMIDKQVEIAGEKFWLGFRIANSYDKTSAIRGDFYAIRLACQNGMLVAHGEEIVLREKHTTKEDVEQLIMKMINNSAKISQEMNMLISEAMEQTFEGELLSKIYKALNLNEKWQEIITEQLHKDWGAKPVYTKWEIYNAITSVATHNHTLGTTMFFLLENKASTSLTMPKQEVLAVVEQ